MRADLGGVPPFVGAYEHLSRQLKRYVIDLSRMMTILDVAELTGLCWDTVKNLVKERLSKDYAHIRLKELRRLALDEIYLGRRQKYLTLVIDQESGRIVWVGRGKAGEALYGFWRRLKASGAGIEAVAMDMSQTYARTVEQHLPGGADRLRPLSRDEADEREARRPAPGTGPGGRE